MKRLLIVLILVILVCLPLLAEIKSADEYDGFAWMRCTWNEKAHIVIGWCIFNAAFRTFLQSIVFQSGVTADEDYYNAARGFNLPGTVGDLIDEIDRYYANYQNRSNWLFLAIPEITGQWKLWAESRK